MATLERTAPIFPVADLDAALAHYRRLGFSTRTYAGGGYGYATRDGVELHLTVVRGHDPKTSTSALYLFVDDADALAAEWEAAGVRVRPVGDTDWGKHEGSHVDPDGNLIRFGSPMG
jgi:catechol 2,3-dioxygenase-like lactoylglutathione lyase family enzyme